MKSLDELARINVPRRTFMCTVGARVLGVNCIKEEHEIALRAERKVNEVDHAAFRTLRRTPSPAGPCPLLRSPVPDGCLPPLPPGRLYPAAADRPLHPGRWLRLSL